MRWIALAILLLALALRLGFVLTLPASPLYWDEQLYGNWATLWARAWSGLFGGSGGPTLLEAFRTSLQKGEAYVAAVGLMYSIFGAQSRPVFIVQALLDTTACLMLYGLARALGGVRAGLIALALAALYEPFIFSAARLQTETLTSLLCVGGLWALCAPERRRSAGHFSAGVLIAASMLARPSLQGLYFVLLPTIPVRNWDRAWRGRLMLALLFSAGFFAVIGPRLLLTKAVTGAAVWSGTLDPSADVYGGAMLSNAGWKTDELSFANPPREELLAVVGEHPASRPKLADFRAAVIRTWELHPFDSTAVALHKLYEAWLYPYNDMRWTFLTGATAQAVWHRVVLVLGLIGLPLALHRWRVGVPLIAATLYLWLSYLVSKIEVRYAVMPMPLMICFAALAVAGVTTGWARAWRAGSRRRLFVLAAATAASLVAALTLSIARLLQFLPLAPEAAHGVRVAVILAVIVSSAYLAAELARQPGKRSAALLWFVPPAAVAALVVLFGRPLAQSWREWQCTLAAHRGVASQEFILPAALERPMSAELKLDLLPARSGQGDLVVRVNGEEIKRYRGGPTRADADLPVKKYYAESFVAQRRQSEAQKAWYTIAIPPDRVEPGARVAVEVALEGAGEPADSVAIFGDYPPDASTYVGPSLVSPLALADTSIFKFIADGDFRMRRRVPLSGSSRSHFSDGDAWSDHDLAFDPGLQQGRYRIFLVLVYERGIAIL